MLRKLFIPALILGLAVVLIGGCSNDSTSANVNDISKDFGGFKPTDEEPAFGNEIIATEMTDDADFDDPILSVSEVEDFINTDTVDIYALRIIWGQPRFDSTVTEVTDWSGSLSISRGAEILRRTIKFEPDQDYILERTDRKLIEWVSETTVHHDGIFVNIIVPKPDPLVDATEETVTFSTTPLEVTFNMSKLAALDTIYVLDDSNVVAFHAFKVERVGCPKGFLSGNWGVDENGENVFYGKWSSHGDILQGHLQGTWGDNQFFGKYIDQDGLFEALLKGRYHQGNSLSPNHRSAGWFRGYYFDANGNILGVLRGHYFENPKGTGMGLFAGRWRHYCGDTPEVDDGLDD